IDDVDPAGTRNRSRIHREILDEPLRRGVAPERDDEPGMFALQEITVAARVGGDEEPLHAIRILVEREAHLPDIVERLVTARVAAAGAYINECPAVPQKVSLRSAAVQVGQGDSRQRAR